MCVTSIFNAFANAAVLMHRQIFEMFPENKNANKKKYTKQKPTNEKKISHFEMLKKMNEEN